MKRKLRYNRNYTVTLITESRSFETWSTMAALTAIVIAVFALLAKPTPRAIVESGSVVAPAGLGAAGSGMGS